MNEAGGTNFPVPGAPTSAFQARTPNVPVTVPYFQPTPDQVAARAQKGAATAHVQQATQEAPQRLAETGRHNRAFETAAGVRFGEQARHNQVGETLGSARLGEETRHNKINETLGGERMQQSGERLSITSGASKGAPTYRDFQTIIEKNNAVKNNILTKMQVWNKEKNRFDPVPASAQAQSVLNQADYNIHQAQHGQRAQARGVSPVTGQGTAPMNPFGAGMQVIRMRGGGSARIPYAPPLPGSNQAPQNAAPVHHSHAQPRRTTGAKAGQFKKDLSKKGKPDLTKMTDAQLFDMIKR